MYDEWLPSFCSDESRNYDIKGFRDESIKVSEFDAENFITALDGGLVSDSGGGRFRCPRSYAFEQIFWTGRKTIVPQPLTLWIEPVITIGTVSRLKNNYNWPKLLICMQSKDWAFDFATFDSPSSEREYIAGEVKKSKKEIDHLIRDLLDFSSAGVTDLTQAASKKRNSCKKWLALQSRKAPYFWAVGPDDYTKLFKVDYYGEGSATFSETELSELSASNV